VHQSPSAHAGFLCALDSAIGPVHDIVIAGERDADDTRALIKGLRDHYLPRVLVILRSSGEQDLLLTSLAPFTRNLNVSGGRATAYICTGNSCAMPITEPDEMLALLGCMNPEV
jgi:uncharacterized protein